MHSLTILEHSFEDIFKGCVNSRKEPVKTQLLTKGSIINEAVGEYKSKMASLKGHTIKTVIDKQSDAKIKKELQKLYSDKMVKGVARPIYEYILAESKSKGCCFCSYAEATEIDHFLPKSKFSEFSIAPINLVPVCNRCNN
nr:hypothetical protein [SAR324 cluster bacterium]